MLVLANELPHTLIYNNNASTVSNLMLLFYILQPVYNNCFPRQGGK